MIYHEIQGILYSKFGAWSKNAFGVIHTAYLCETCSIHELVKKVGYSYRFVREIFYTLEDYITFDNKNGNFEFSKDLVLMLEAYKDESDAMNQENIKNAIDIIVDGFKKHNEDLDHISATKETCYIRAKYLYDNFDVETCNILFVGDHDFSSLSLALYAKHHNKKNNLYVCDLDDNVLTHILNMCKKYDLNIQLSHSDFRYSVPSIYFNNMDVVFTDPPYTPEGIGVFLNRSLECLKYNAFSTLCLAYKTAEMTYSLGLAVQKELLGRGLYIRDLKYNFNHYIAAEALGYRSDLYVCQLTSYTQKYLESAKYYDNIYTHGKNAVESSSDKIDLNAIIEVIKENDTISDVINLVSAQDEFSYQGKLKINQINLRNYIIDKQSGKSNISKNSTIILNGTNYDINYNVRPLLLFNMNKFYCVLNEQQVRQLSSNRIIKLMKIRYYMNQLVDSNGKYLYQFVQKQSTDYSNNPYHLLLFYILSYSGSNLRNAFVKAVTKITGITKNEARDLFEKLSFSMSGDLLLFNVSLDILENIMEEKLDLQLKK